MSKKCIEQTQLIVKKLDTSLDLSKFDCSLDDDMGLNEFIHKEAIDYQNEGLGVTHVFYYEGNPVGYVTLAMDNIKVKHTKLPLRVKANIKQYPALLLGRIGVDNLVRKRSVGRCVCLWTVGLAKILSEKVACRFIVLLTNQQKRKFYEKCGFEVCPGFENKSRPFMYFQLY